MPTALRAALPLAAFVLAACAGPVSDVTVTIPPHEASGGASLLASAPSTRIELHEIREPLGPGLPPGQIGERKTVGDASMGLVSIRPEPGRLLTDMLSAELTAAGHQLTGNDAEVSIDGRVDRFLLRTDVTTLYWDVVLDVAMRLVATVPGHGETRDYTARCSERTYAWPGEKIITRVVGTCIDNLARQFRDDREIAGLLGR